MRTAIQLEPQNGHFRLNLASLQMRLRDFDGARKTLESLLNTDVKESARAMLNSLDNYKRALESPNGVVIVGDVPGDTEPTRENEKPTLKRKERGEEEPPRTNSPTGAPVSLDGTEHLSGVVTAVECKGNSMVISLKAGDKVARFFVEDHNRVPFFSRALAYSVDIVCGPNTLQATIYFKPAADKAQFAGVVVAVEFKQ
jgi:hypothetical protein